MASATVLRAAVALALGLVAMAVIAYLMRRGRVHAGADAMTLWQHIEELRTRLLVAVASWLAAVVVVFSFRLDMRGGWPVPVPALQDNIAAQAFRAIADHLVPAGVELIVVRPLDAFLAELTVAAGLGAALSMPVWLTQIAGFFSPALRDKERRALKRGILPATALFAAGAAFAWYAVLPFLLRTLYGYATALGARPFLQVSELVTFTVMFLFIFGVAFQLPLVMGVLARAGLVRARTFAKGWRVAVVAILIASALMTDPTIFSQVMVAGPLLGLYGIGILAARAAERRRQGGAPVTS